VLTKCQTQVEGLEVKNTCIKEPKKDSRVRASGRIPCRSFDVQSTDLDSLPFIPSQSPGLDSLPCFLLVY
jgi:hypothetical protein